MNINWTQKIEKIVESMSTWRGQAAVRHFNQCVAYWEHQGYRLPAAALAAARIRLTQ